MNETPKSFSFENDFFEVGGGKNIMLYKWPENVFATKLYVRKSGEVGTSSIFVDSKMLQKLFFKRILSITYFDLLRTPFVDLESASRQVPKMQNFVIAKKTVHRWLARLASGQAALARARQKSKSYSPFRCTQCCFRKEL